MNVSTFLMLLSVSVSTLDLGLPTDMDNFSNHQTIELLDRKAGGSSHLYFEQCFNAKYRYLFELLLIASSDSYCVF